MSEKKSFYIEIPTSIDWYIICEVDSYSHATKLDSGRRIYFHDKSELDLYKKLIPYFMNIYSNGVPNITEVTI